MLVAVMLVAVMLVAVMLVAVMLVAVMLVVRSPTASHCLGKVEPSTITAEYGHAIHVSS